MRIVRQQRSMWFLIAILAMGIALLLMLVPHGHNTHSGDWLAILPIFLVGLISPLTLFPAFAVAYSSRVPNAPALSASFERPPPFLLA
ncbi:MAG: hypothetical protein KGM96_15995 [Acidobacteriota bacterium]|nr:hypothetical protein [Acidobacteriota bacterium]